MDLCFQSLVKSFLFFFLSSLFFPPPWKDSLTNYDSWVEGLSLFTLQRQTCESRGARDVISVSTVHLLFRLWCVKVVGICQSWKSRFQAGRGDCVCWILSAHLMKMTKRVKKKRFKWKCIIIVWIFIWWLTLCCWWCLSFCILLLGIHQFSCKVVQH